MTKTLQDTIKFVNAVRLTLGAPPLNDLPRGDHSGYSCPVAKSIPGCKYAHTDGVRLGTGENIKFPPTVAQWVEEFDFGWYPSYEQDDVLPS